MKKFLLSNLEKDINALEEKYEIFNKEMEYLIDVLEKETGLPLRKMKTEEAYCYIDSGMKLDNPSAYTFRWADPKKSNSGRVNLTFFINGTIKVWLYWRYHYVRGEKTFKNISPEKLIKLAPQIKEHLMKSRKEPPSEGC